MTRKVNLWIVIALAAALAVSLAVVGVLANDDGRGAPAFRGPAGDAWYQAWGESGDAPAPPMMGSLGGWERREHTPLLPWVLFALATGTAVGLFVAWSPWRAQPAAAPEEAAVNVSVANGSAIEGMARLEDEGRSDEAADASATGDAATPETPPQA